jgi:hypothetical protein
MPNAYPGGMASKANKKKKGGRVTPKGTRPPEQVARHRQTGPNADPFDRIINEGGLDMLKTGDPVAAEVWASQLVAAFDAAEQEAILEGIEDAPLYENFFDRCRSSASPRSLAAVAAAASVFPSPLDDDALAVLEELRAAGVTSPEFLDLIGETEASQAWTITDSDHAQQVVALRFRPRGEGRDTDEHALAVFVDDATGQISDAWLADNAETFLEEWAAKGEAIIIEPAEVDDSLKAIAAALLASETADDDGDAIARTIEYIEHKALILARLRRSGVIIPA